MIEILHIWDIIVLYIASALNMNLLKLKKYMYTCSTHSYAHINDKFSYILLVEIPKIIRMQYSKQKSQQLKYK